MREISFTNYLDRVHGGWFGKCLGGAAGAKLEGTKNINDIKDFREVFDPNLPNDDLDIQVLWLEVLEKHGADITSKLLAEYWDKKCWYPFSEYGYFLKNYELGVMPPYSGEFNNSFFKEAMGCPIRSEIWGYSFIGNPKLASQYAGLDGRLDHIGESVVAEKYFAAMESLSFFYKDVKTLLFDTKMYLEKGTRLCKCIELVFENYEKTPYDFMNARKEVLRLYGHNDFTNAVQNIAFTIIALLYGNGNLNNTINIALKCGYDTDCTCATAGAILGTIIGYVGIDAELKQLIDDCYVLGIDVARKNNSIKQLAYDTCAVGVNMCLHENMEVKITDLPRDFKYLCFQKNMDNFEIAVDYLTTPTVVTGRSSLVRISIKNKTKQAFDGIISFSSNRQYLHLPTDIKVHIDDMWSDEIEINCSDTNIIYQKNIIEVALKDLSENVIYEDFFGFVGESIWKLYGPYFEPYEKFYVKDKSVCDFECAVNNIVFLDKDYMDSEYTVINCSEDLLTIDENITMSGQMCCYLEANIYCEEAKDIWLLIGNNDAFEITLNGISILKKDEIRLWTPYNNHIRTKFEKGENTVLLKLLRRTESLKFSFGIRNDNGSRWNDNRWCTDLGYRNMR